MTELKASAHHGMTYPRQRARTRGFRSGAPRQPSISPEGTRVVFCRSEAGDNASQDLWVLDLSVPENPTEHCVVRTAGLMDADGETIPAAEAARRERMRESSEGITSYTVNSDVTFAVFTLHGSIFIASLTDLHGNVRKLNALSGAVDARISPDGARVGYVADRALHVINLADDSHETLAVPAHDFDSWGLADFIAAEEFSRVRGWWWSADSHGILAQHVDESDVHTWWIANPAQPEQPARTHRYPSAGTPNPRVHLWYFSLDGQRQELSWNHEEYEYLASVQVARSGPIIIEVLSRDQRSSQVLRWDDTTASPILLSQRQDPHWIDVFPGAPGIDASGELLQITADLETDTNRLLCNDRFLTPPGLQVRAISAMDGDRCLVHGSLDPTEELPYLVSGGRVVALAAHGVATATVRGSIAVVSATNADTFHTRMTVYRVGAELSSASDLVPIAEITSFAHSPELELNVSIQRLGEDAFPAAIVWPRGHVPGSTRLPILLAPYGGPHARRVIAAGLAYASDQWWADQGYCVVVIDGCGTPGRGPAWERMVSGDLATPVLTDQMRGLAAVIAAHPHDVDPQRVGIHGWSFGGYLAALAAMSAPGRIHAAVAGAPVTEWRLYDTAYTERYLGDPHQNPDAYDGSSLLPLAPQLQCPLLLIHGLADDNVAVAHTLQLSSALLAAGKPHSVLPLSGVSHMTPQEVVAENLLLAQRDFFATHLQG